MDELKDYLNEYEISLKDNLFVTGSEPSYEDAKFFKLLIDNKYKPYKDEYPNVWSWYSLIILFEDEAINSWAKKPKKQIKHKFDKKTKNVDNQPYILTEPDNWIEKSDYQKIINEQKEKHKNERSNIFLQINPRDNEQNLDNLAQKIFKLIKRNDLIWSKKYEIKDNAFNIKKLIIGMNAGNDLSVQDVVDQLETWEEEIQSVDFVLFSQC